MKQVVAIIKPFLAEKVIREVSELSIDEISIREVKGFGRQKNYLDHYADNEFSRAFVPKVEISVWVEDASLDAVLDKMVSVARTGRLGDGKIFVLPIVHAVDVMNEITEIEPEC